MISFADDDDLSIQFRNLKIVDQVESANQITTLFMHPTYGRIMAINGEVQTVEQWECFYHEPLVHLPMTFIKNPKSALILGGGDLFAAKEVLKYPTIQNVTLCDHDPKVIDLSVKYYSHAKDVIKDARLNIVSSDLFVHLAKTKHQYDIIINDAIDPFALSHKSGNLFFKNVIRVMSEVGVYCELIYRSIFEKKCCKRMFEKMNDIKNYEKAYSFLAIPEYPGIFHVMAIFGKSKYITQSIKKPVNFQQLKWIRSKSDVFEVFNPAYLGFYFYLPPFLRDTTFQN